MVVQSKRCLIIQILGPFLLSWIIFVPTCAIAEKLRQNELYQNQFQTARDSDALGILDSIQNNHQVSRVQKVLPIYTEKGNKEYSETEDEVNPNVAKVIDDQPNQISARLSDYQMKLSKRKMNATVSQMKLLENMLFNFFSSACPKLNETYPYLLSSSRHLIQAKIRNSAHLLPKKADKTEKLYHLMRSILQCTSTLNSKNSFEMHSRLGRQGDNALSTPQKKSSTLFYRNIREQLDAEEKRLKIESQQDVIPTDENLVLLVTVIQNILEQKCKNISRKWESEIQGLSGILKYLIRTKTKNFPGHKTPTVHQSEMFQMLDDAKKCADKMAKT